MDASEGNSSAVVRAGARTGARVGAAEDRSPRQAVPEEASLTKVLLVHVTPTAMTIVL